MQLPELTTSAATSAGERREHSARCTTTNKTKRMHATAVVDDERGNKEKERQRPQDPSLPNHVENMKFFQSHPQADEEYVSTVKPKVARHGLDGKYCKII